MNPLKETLDQLATHANAQADDVHTAMKRIQEELIHPPEDINYDILLHELEKIERFHNLMRRLSIVVEIHRKTKLT